MMDKLELQVRGIHGGVLIALPLVPWYQQRDLLVGRIQTQERFFKGGRLALDAGSTDWSEDQLLKLMKSLADEGVCLWTILSTSETTRQAAQYHGFPTSLPDPNKKTSKTEVTAALSGLVSFDCLPRSLAEDEELMHNGNLLLIGDVPENARLGVAGSLVLWGTLHGLASMNMGTDLGRYVRLLRLGKGRLVLDGEEVEVPLKMRKRNGLVISRDENGINIISLKPGRLL